MKPQGDPEALAESCIAKLAELDHKRRPGNGRKCKLRRSEQIRHQLLRELLKEADYPVGEVKRAPLP